MSLPLNRHLPIKGTFNVRDLGGYATAAGETRWRRVLRADGLHRVDSDGMSTLVAAGVSTVIDLRHPGELATQPNPFNGQPQVRYHNVSLFDSLAPEGRSGYLAWRPRLLAGMDRILDHGNRHQRDRDQGQSQLFGGDEEPGMRDDLSALPAVPPWTVTVALSF